MVKTLVSKSCYPVVGPYSHAVKLNDTLYFSGIIPLDKTTGVVVNQDIKSATQKTLEIIDSMLVDFDLTLNDVVKSTVFLTSLEDFDGMNEVYAKFFSESMPARSTVEVSKLPKESIIEIEVIVDTKN